MYSHKHTHIQLFTDKIVLTCQNVATRDANTASGNPTITTHLMLSSNLYRSVPCPSSLSDLGPDFIMGLVELRRSK